MSQKNTGFVSEIDRFLQNFDQKHPELSVSQKKEKAKFQRIYRLRDKVERQNQPKHLDEWFDKNE